ncbi:UPF0041-domain-containing protein [Peniophora sp. CONT]|nr:UPF0041-domain-containing protein [Peniophora sp. CONT]
MLKLRRSANAWSACVDYLSRHIESGNGHVQQPAVVAGSLALDVGIIDVESPAVTSALGEGLKCDPLGPGLCSKRLQQGAILTLAPTSESAPTLTGTYIVACIRPKTVFFWAPVMKWCLVVAGLKDLNRPVEKLSVSQNIALTATGFIWVRWSLVITPVNYSLAAVNVLVGSSGLAQLVRIANYRYNTPDKAVKPTPA